MVPPIFGVGCVTITDNQDMPTDQPDLDNSFSETPFSGNSRLWQADIENQHHTAQRTRQKKQEFVV